MNMRVLHSSVSWTLGLVAVLLSAAWIDSRPLRNSRRILALTLSDVECDVRTINGYLTIDNERALDIDLDEAARHLEATLQYYRSALNQDAPRHATPPLPLVRP